VPPTWLLRPQVICQVPVARRSVFCLDKKGLQPGMAAQSLRTGFTSQNKPSIASLLENLIRLQDCTATPARVSAHLVFPTSAPALLLYPLLYYLYSVLLQCKKINSLVGCHEVCMDQAMASIAGIRYGKVTSLYMPLGGI
jgi:hypothetical protein